MRSTHACGVTPARAAAWITDWLCSSIPIRKWTASPRSRRYRAMQSPASSRDLRRVEGEVLVLGERQAHRPQLRQPAGAAVLAAAAAHPVEPLGLVACADLPQLDARVKQAREVPHQGAEVHPLFGG